MPVRSHLPPAERQAVSRLRSLLNEPGFAHGSLRVNRRRCGKPTCRCASGEPHASLSLVVVENGRQIAVHIPTEWESRVRSWVERDREVRSLLLEISRMYVQRLRERKE